MGWFGFGFLFFWFGFSIVRVTSQQSVNQQNSVVESGSGYNYGVVPSSNFGGGVHSAIYGPGTPPVGHANGFPPYQVYPSRAGYGGGDAGSGWGSDDNNNDFGDLPVGLIGLLGLKGVAGLKGVGGLAVVLKGLALLAKLGLSPLWIPLLLPLFLLKALSLVLPLLLLLFIPIPVIVAGRPPVGRREMLDKLMENFPVDMGHLENEANETNSRNGKTRLKI